MGTGGLGLGEGSAQAGQEGLPGVVDGESYGFVTFKAVALANLHKSIMIHLNVVLSFCPPCPGRELQLEEDWRSVATVPELEIVWHQL